MILAGERVTVQLFILRLNYSKARFVMAFPFQKQEAFFEGHNQAFRFFGGIPRRLTYDNLKTAVYKILSGHNRHEQENFKKYRSYYLFESFYCNPAQGHEKGGVENDDQLYGVGGISSSDVFIVGRYATISASSFGFPLLSEPVILAVAAEIALGEEGDSILGFLLTIFWRLIR